MYRSIIARVCEDERAGRVSGLRQRIGIRAAGLMMTGGERNTDRDSVHGYGHARSRERMIARILTVTSSKKKDGSLSLSLSLLHSLWAYGCMSWLIN